MGDYCVMLEEKLLIYASKLRVFLHRKPCIRLAICTRSGVLKEWQALKFLRSIPFEVVG